MLGFDEIVDPLFDMGHERRFPSPVEPIDMRIHERLVGGSAPNAALSLDPTPNDVSISLQPRRARRLVTVDKCQQPAGLKPRGKRWEHDGRVHPMDCGSDHGQIERLRSKGQVFSRTTNPKDVAPAQAATLSPRLQHGGRGVHRNDLPHIRCDRPSDFPWPAPEIENLAQPWGQV